MKALVSAILFSVFVWVSSQPTDEPLLAAALSHLIKQERISDFHFFKSGPILITLTNHVVEQGYGLEFDEIPDVSPRSIHFVTEDDIKEEVASRGETVYFLKIHDVVRQDSIYTVVIETDFLQHKPDQRMCCCTVNYQFAKRERSWAYKGIDGWSCM